MSLRSAYRRTKKIFLSFVKHICDDHSKWSSCLLSLFMSNFFHVIVYLLCSFLSCPIPKQISIINFLFVEPKLHLKCSINWDILHQKISDDTIFEIKKIYIWKIKKSTFFPTAEFIWARGRIKKKLNLKAKMRLMESFSRQPDTTLNLNWNIINEDDRIRMNWMTL